MANKVLLKKSSTGAKVPLTSDLDYGELALNYADGKLYYKNSSNVVQSFGSTSFTRVTSNTTAIAGKKYICDTSNGGLTLTLPASPVTGDSIIIADGADFSTYSCTISRNGSTIEGVADNLALNIGGIEVTLTFDGTTWNVYAQVGGAGGTAVSLTGTQTLTNKTLTSPTIAGTVPSITIAGPASVTTNSSTDKFLGVGTHGQLFDDGNFHIHANSGTLWLNSLDGGDIALGLQSNSGTSKATANNISMNAGYGSIAPIFGVRAWISCGYIGSTMVTNASGNLSVSRVSAGKYAFTFGTAMPDGNYSVTATCKTPVDNSDVAANLGYNIATTTTGFTIHCARYGTGFLDVPQLCVQVVR